MKNKKGFTLIELLAVIVILAIIAIIAIPIILNMINNARKQAAIDTAYGYVESVEYAMGLSDIGATGYENINIKNQEYEIDDPDLANIKIKGKKPDSGTIAIEKRKITTGSFCIDGYKVDYDGKEARASKSNSCKTGGSSSDEEEQEELVQDKVPCELETEKIGDKDVYYIDSVEDMYAFSASVNGGNNYSGKTVILRNNLDFSEYTADKKTKVCSNNDNANGFTPINEFSGTFKGNGKTIKNLTIDRPNQDEVGIFSYTLYATITDLILDNITVTGNEDVGALVGYNQETSLIEIVLKNINVTGSSSVGGLTGYLRVGYVNNILVKNANITSENSTVHPIYPGADIRYIRSIVEQSTVNSTNFTPPYSQSDVGDINFYEIMGMDTWIGGDNNNTGFYFDYENNNSNNIVLKSVENNPLPQDYDSAFAKSGDYYLIKNTNDWKSLAALITSSSGKKVKLTNDLDFKNNHYYMLGDSSDDKYCHLTFDGDAHTIKNVTINASIGYEVGMFGITQYGSIIGLNLENITVIGGDEVGALVGYNQETTLKEISLKNINVKGSSSVGGLTGYLRVGYVSDILVKNATVTSDDSSANPIFQNWNSSYSNAIVEKASISTTGTPATSSNYSSLESNDNLEDLTYYSGKIETVLNGDSNNTGYYFDYDTSTGEVVVKKAEIEQGWKQLTPKTPTENQKWVYFKADGTKYSDELVSDTITDLSGTIQDYYFDEDGLAYKGWKQLGGYWYYFSELDADNNGWIDFNKVRGGSVTIGNKTCTFDSDGKCTSDNCGP